MSTTADFRTGMCVELNNDIFQIIEFQHVKMQQRRPIVRTKLKSMTTGKVLEYTFNAGDKVETARIEYRNYQFLYKDESGYTFMEQTTYEQVTIPETLINNPKLLKEGREVQIHFHADTEKVLFCELPPFVVMKVTYTEPGIRGDTATNTLKSATVETGATIRVPLFVDNEQLIKIDTRNNSYVERVK